jgi:uncharacterized protein
VLVQIALLFILIPSSHFLVEATVRFLCSQAVAAAILGCDTGQFIVMLISIVGSILLCVRWLDRRSFADLGVVVEKGALADYFYGLAIAVVLVALMLLIELACGAARINCLPATALADSRLWLGIVDGLCACVMIGFQEELLRFYQIKNLSEGLSGFKPIGKSGAIISATIFGSVFFGCLHGANNGITPQAILLLALNGFILSLIYITTGRAWLAFGFHTGWDFAEGNLFGFPVSGYRETYTLISTQQPGAPVFTGGSFGPDGGLINLVMIVLGTLLIITWIRLRYREFKLKLDLCDWVP